MTENIIIAILGVIASFIGSATLVNYRLKKLEEKVDEHNGYAEKIANIHTDIALMQKDISYIKSAIEKLERKD